MDTSIFNYNGNNITFKLGNGDVMVNATQMARHFSKQTSDWTKTKSSQEFITSLSAVRKIVGTELVKVVQGGNAQGTWMHEDVAIEFARWLSPEFAIWCNDRIKEILKFGISATQPTLDNIIADPEFGIKLLTQLKHEREEKERLQVENNRLKPRDEFVSKVFATENLITMSQAAKILKLPYGRNTLLKKLREKGVLFKNGNEPMQQFVDKGYFVVKEKIQERDNKPPMIFMQTFPTQKGLAYIAKILGVVEVPQDRRTAFV